MFTKQYISYKSTQPSEEEEQAGDPIIINLCQTQDTQDETPITHNNKIFNTGWEEHTAGQRHLEEQGKWDGREYGVKLTEEWKGNKTPT